MKDEVEHSSETQRRQNIDLMNLIKGISSTLKKLKEAQITFTTDELKLKDTIALIVSHQNYIGNFINLQNVTTFGLFDDYVHPGMSIAGTGRSSTQMGAST